MTPQEVGRRWREESGYVGRGGVIVLFNGEVQSWVNELRNPEHWQPGCLAVDERGCSWTTIAGNERDGALILKSTGTEGAGPDETVFATSGSALVALAGIGFDLYREGLGCWRPDPVIAEREHVRMRAIFAWGIRQLRR